MKITFYFIISLLIIAATLMSCNGNKDSNFIFDNYDEYDIDSVVHYYHNDSIIDEYELFEEDELLSSFVNGDEFNLNNLNKLNFYFDKKKVYEDESIHSINSAVKLVDKDKKEEHTKCLPVYRDLLLYYAEGEFKGCIKICFSCSQYLVCDFDPNYTKFVDESKRKIEVDYSVLKDVLNK